MTPAPAVDPLSAEEPQAPPSPQELYGDRLQELPEQLVNALREAVKDFQGQEKYLRRREVMRDRRNRFYERGVQHIYWNSQGNSPGFTVMVAGSIGPNSVGQDVQAPRYIDDYNIFQPYERVLMANLTQNPPGIDFRPQNPDRPDDKDAAETAEGYRHLFDRSNSVKQIQIEITRMMALSGRTILWTRTEADAQKFGLNDAGEPKSMEITTVHGTLESKVPILCKCQGECLYMFLADDPDVKDCKAEYPEFKDKIKAGIAGLGENAYERLARLGVLQGTKSEMQSADAYTHLVTRLNCWMRPNAFTGDRYDEPLEEKSESDLPGMTVGDKLKELFPEGVRVIFIGDVYVGAYAESMDDHLEMGFPYEGDGLNRMSLMDPMIVVQDTFNDAMNVAREVFDFGWPSTWLNCETTEYDTIVRQRADPFAVRQLKNVPNGMKATDLFYREPNPELPASFLEYVQNVQGQLPQFILAAPPALFGAAMEDQKTASGYAQARSQALGQQGLVWAQMQVMMARMYYQAALCAANNPDHAQGVLVPGGNGQTATIDIQKISKGHFGAYPDEDSSFPESTAAKRATLEQILLTVGPTPIGAQMLQVPKNMKTYMAINGFPEIVIPEAEAYDKQSFEIEQLLKTSPIPPDPMVQDQAMIDHAAAAVKMQSAGQDTSQIPPPPQIPAESTVPVNEWDFHQWEASACQDWLNSQDCRRQQAMGNTQGIQNVVLHWKQHLAMIPPAPLPVVPGEAAGGPPKPASAAPGGPLLPQSTQAPGSPGMATM